MNAMSAALSPMASPQPAAQAPREGDARGGEFARCLGQACEGEGGNTADTAPASEAPPRPAAKARSGRETTAPRKAEARAEKEAPTKAPAETEAASQTDAPAGPAPHDDAAAPDLAALLPGWAPPAIAAASTVSNANAPDSADALQAAAAATGAAPAAAFARDAAASRTATPMEVPTLRIAATVATNAPAPAASSSASLQAAASEHKDTLPIAEAAMAPTPMPFALAVTPAAAKSADAAPPTAALQAQIDAPAFAPALATQVRWWANDGVQQAQLLLNPAEMGPVAVKIVLDGREARIDFSADVAATRSAIEAALPVLAAALDDSGLKLSGGGVHDGSAQRQSDWHDRDVTHRTSGPASTRAGDAPGGAGASSASAGRGLVDLVA